jgi:hypothetical protein
LNNISSIPRVSAVQEGALNAGQTFGGGGRSSVNTAPVSTTMDTPPVQTPSTVPVGSAVDTPPVGTPNTPPVGTPDTTPVPDDVQSGAWSAVHMNGTNSRVQVDYLPTLGAQAIEHFGNLLDVPPPTAVEKAAYARIRAWDQKNIHRVAANAELNDDVVRAAHQHMLVTKHIATIHQL